MSPSITSTSQHSGFPQSTHSPHASYSLSSTREVPQTREAEIQPSFDLTTANGRVARWILDTAEPEDAETDYATAPAIGSEATESASSRPTLIDSSSILSTSEAFECDGIDKVDLFESGIPSIFLRQQITAHSHEMCWIPPSNAPSSLKSSSDTFDAQSSGSTPPPPPSLISALTSTCSCASYDEDEDEDESEYEDEFEDEDEEEYEDEDEDEYEAEDETDADSDSSADTDDNLNSDNADDGQMDDIEHSVSSEPSAAGPSSTYSTYPTNTTNPGTPQATLESILFAPFLPSELTWGTDAAESQVFWDELDSVARVIIAASARTLTSIRALQRRLSEWQEATVSQRTADVIRDELTARVREREALVDLRLRANIRALERCLRE